MNTLPVPDDWNLDQRAPKSLHELCPKCGSADRGFIGVEAEFMIEDEALWHCNGCHITYGSPVPPYTDQPLIDKETMSEFVDELVNMNHEQ